MSKEGHEGVVKTASKPIEPIKKLNPFSGSQIGPNMLAQDDSLQMGQHLLMSPNDP